jgi:autotransporter-associated beta strand protein
VRFNLKKGSNASASLTIGGIARADVFPGTLYLAPSGGTNTLGVSEKFFLTDPSALVHAGSGMVSPVVTLGGPNATGTPVCFARYDASSGLVPAANLYREGFAGADADSIVRVTANTTLSADTAIHALVIDGNAALTLNPGVTLTIGDGTAPAGIILQGFTTTKTCISGGAIDFRGSEGIVWMQDNNNRVQQTIDTEIRGTAGVTFTGRNNVYLVNTVLQGTYDNSGDLRVYWGRMQLYAGLSSSPSVRVFGDRLCGGQLLNYTQTSISELSLAGFGISGSHGPSALTGTGEAYSTNIARVVLADDAGIRLNSDLRLDCPVTGPGGLAMLQDTHTLILNGANTYLGATRLEVGTLTLGTNGTFGAGEVMNGTTITINKNADFVVSNAVSGVGSWVNSGTNTLLFANPSVTMAGLTTQGDVGIAGAETRLGNLAQVTGRTITPIAEGADAPAMAGIGTSSDIVYSGHLRDNGTNLIGLAKIGPGALGIAKPQDYSGPTVVREGTLRLLRETIPCEADIVYHLDAGDAASVLTDGATGAVTSWVDRVAGVTFKQSGSLPCPVYSNGVGGAIQAKPAVYFNGWTNCLVANKAFATKTVLILFQATGYNTGGGGMDCIWAVQSGDWGSRFLRMASATSIGYAEEGNPFHYSTLANMSINGVAGISTFTQNAPTLVSSFRTDAFNAGNNVIGNNYQNRSLCGFIGEVIAFGRALSRDEIKAVENHMWRKWMETELHAEAPGLVTGTLPAGTALSLEPGAAFDLNGIDQTVSSLSGIGGSVVNSGAATATLTVTGTNGFRGTVGEKVNLVLCGAADMALRAEAGSVTFSDAAAVSVYNALPPQDGILYWLDATETATVQCSSEGYVTNWVSRAGVEGLSFGLEKPGWDAVTSQPPTYTGSINELNAVFFGNTTTNWMKANRSVTVQTLVMVFQAFQNQMSMAGYWGVNSGGDTGIRGASTNFSYGTMGNCFAGSTAWHNGTLLGASSDSFNYVLNTPVTVHIESPVKVGTGYNAIAGYFVASSTDTRRFRGAIGEVIAYDRMLTEVERTQLEHYLALKWRTPGYAVNTEAFAAGSEITLAAGASLDLRGAPLVVARLSGGGVTGDVTVTDTYTVTLDENGGCPYPLAVTGDLTFTGCGLTVVGTLKNAQHKVKIAEAGGTLTGLPSWDEPQPGWQVLKEGDAVHLYKNLGTTVILR